tara:strand:+ start:587 stop:877 length:291 start_codon:yes stop_codon:yes gene_type:complete
VNLLNDTTDANKSVEKDDVDWLNDSKKTRDIAQEILRFGVSQNQIKLIIGLLALELEDRDAMLSIKKCVDPQEDLGEDENNIYKSKILYPEGVGNE